MLPRHQLFSQERKVNEIKNPYLTLRHLSTSHNPNPHKLFISTCHQVPILSHPLPLECASLTTGNSTTLSFPYEAAPVSSASAEETPLVLAA
jgi:hypothetical protein